MEKQELMNFDGLRTIILSFAIALIVLKFLKKGFETYIMWVEGDNDTSPITFVTYFARALIMAVSFPVLYEWLITVSKDLANQVMTTLNLQEQYSLTTAISSLAFMNIFLAIVGLIIIIMLFSQLSNYIICIVITLHFAYITFYRKITNFLSKVNILIKIML